MTDPADDAEPVVRLERWQGPWPPDDPDANFKSDVALYALVDPLSTITNLSRASTSPSAPSAVMCWPSGPRAAAADSSSSARLAAYHQLRQMLEWLKLPLSGDTGYNQQD